MRALRRRFTQWQTLAGAGLLVLLSACAGPQSTSGPEPRTASDQTDADRRAAVRVELAAGYFARGQHNTALDEIKQALAAKPDYREALNLRGLIYAALGEMALADESFRRTLSLYPRDGDTLHNFGWFLCQQQRWTEAFAQFDLALAQPQYRGMGRTLLAKGVCEARSGRPVEAERSLSRAFELEPANPAIAVNLADVLLRAGQLDRARFYAKRVNDQPELSNAESLWLGLRIERRMGNRATVDELAQRLRQRFPQSRQKELLDKGQYDE